MLRIALLTGVRAYQIIEREAGRAASELRGTVELKVFRLPIHVMSLATTEALRAAIEVNRELKSELERFDLIILPGTVKGDAREVEAVVGRPVYKGSADPSLLSRVLEHVLRGGELSREKAAEDLLLLDRLESLRSTLRSLTEKSPTAFEVGSLKVPTRGPPVLLMAETPTWLEVDEICEHVSRLEESGADAIIVGAPLGESAEEVERRFKAASKCVGRAALGVDSARPAAIERCLDAGAEIAMSIHEGNMHRFERHRRAKAFVVIPSDPYSSGALASGESVSLLRANLRRAAQLGYEKLLADLVTPPPCLGLVEALAGYLELSSDLSVPPLLMGFANISELIDADSHGVNALLSAIAVELGVSAVLVVEDSWKTRGSTAEVKVGLVMASTAKERGVPPVDLGVDLILLKSKRGPAAPSLLSTARAVIEVPDEVITQRTLDRYRAFVEADHDRRRLLCCIAEESSESSRCYVGRGALQLLRAVLRDYPDLSREHIAYLGAELQKAEEALRAGRSYAQDSPLLASAEEKLRRLEEALGTGSRH